METLPITLKVKAPNQQIEDQTIKCELSWTINKLKQHLSEVYPNKPPKHEQKLIYSGQLLSDSLKLKDVLRQYDGQEVHTLHLVCTSKQMKFNKSEPQQPQQRSTANTTTTTTTTTTPPTTPSTPAPIQVQPSNVTNQVPSFTWAPTPNGAPMDLNQYAMQLAWMQQNYMQYMTQYMQLATNGYGNINFPTAQQYHLQQQNFEQLPSATPQPPLPPQQQQNQPHNVGGQQAEAAAPIPPVRDPDHPERDWLDIFYMLSRVMVLFSVVYFYSSPLRFMFVLLLGVLIYLYQIGFFRNINNNNNNNNNTVPPEPVAQDEEQAPSRLMIVWSFFATFFASLIPEIPNAV